jgi:hypothetical protein
MEKVKTKSQKKKKRYITLRHISAGVAAAAVIAISFVALGEMDEPKEMELTNRFITSRVSDEPVQKDADKSTDHISASEEKNVNKKTSQASKNTVIEENLQTEQQMNSEILHKEDEFPNTEQQYYSNHPFSTDILRSEAPNHYILMLQVRYK